MDDSIGILLARISTADLRLTLDAVGESPTASSSPRRYASRLGSVYFANPVRDRRDRLGYLANMRNVLAAVLFVFTGACFLVAGIIASTVFDSYKDSEDSYYLSAAALPLGIGLACLAGGVWAIRSRVG